MRGVLASGRQPRRPSRWISMGHHPDSTDPGPGTRKRQSSSLSCGSLLVCRIGSTGDVGDFLKFGLLRRLCEPADGQPGLRLGVVWYLTPDEGHNADGKHTDYLDETESASRDLAALDPDLYQRLQRVVAGDRSVEALEAAGVLPDGSQTFGEQLSFADLASTDRVGEEAKAERVAGRTRPRRSRGVIWCSSIPTTACDQRITLTHRLGPKRSSMPTTTSFKHSPTTEDAALSPTTTLGPDCPGFRAGPAAPRGGRRRNRSPTCGDRHRARNDQALRCPGHREHLQQRLRSIESGERGAVLKVAWPEGDPTGAH